MRKHIDDLKEWDSDENKRLRHNLKKLRNTVKQLGSDVRQRRKRVDQDISQRLNIIQLYIEWNLEGLEQGYPRYDGGENSIISEYEEDE